MSVVVLWGERSRCYCRRRCCCSWVEEGSKAAKGKVIIAPSMQGDLEEQACWHVHNLAWDVTDVIMAEISGVMNNRERTGSLHVLMHARNGCAAEISLKFCFSPVAGE